MRTTGKMCLHPSANAQNCLGGNLLIETGKKLSPFRNPGVKRNMVSVIDITNHIHGFIESQIKLGLYYNDELVSLMIFKKQKKNIYEMLRFCDKLNTSVVGDKLFKYFVDNYNPVEIISYADRSWSQGKLYKALGFIYVNKIKPKYYYIINGHRKDKSDLDSQNRKIYRIYDSGSLKFIWKK